MQSAAAWGVVCLSLQAIFVTLLLVLSRQFLEWGWPYFTVMGLTHSLCAVVIIAGIRLSGTNGPAPHVRKWVLLRGMFGCGAFAAQLIAVRSIGTGDVATLTSVNTVVAALLARSFLGEALSWPHAVSFCSTVVGAGLIARPSFIFGDGDAEGQSSAAGYVLAIASGFFYAGAFVCSRKATGSSVWHLTLVVVSITAIVCFVLPHTSLVQEEDIKQVEGPMWRIVGMMGVLLLSTLLGWVTLCAGAKWCPAALSATTMTCVRMVLGYAVQVMVFDTKLDPITLFGAGLMLLSVLLVATARSPPTSVAASAEDGRADEAGTISMAQAEVRDDGAATPALAAFIAEECAEFSLPSCSKPGDQNAGEGPRLRAAAAAATLPQTLGVVAITAP